MFWFEETKSAVSIQLKFHHKHPGKQSPAAKQLAMGAVVLGNRKCSERYIREMIQHHGHFVCSLFNDAFSVSQTI
jgi:hypothetical protein